MPIKMNRIRAKGGLLFDVGGLDDAAGGGLHTIAGEGAGLFVARDDFGFEAVVAAFVLFRRLSMLISPV
jgi:hypothetical protein